jgi:ketosteroid isomerase-like protein
VKISLKIVLSTLILLLVSTQIRAQEATKAHKDSLGTIIKNYYSLNLKMFQAGSTVEDIDKAFALFTDNFTYVHSKYGGNYTRESLYKSALRNQQEGRYNGTVVDMKIANRIIGLNGAAVQKRFVEKKDGKIIESELQMTLFEFKDGKISRIVEYW